MARLRSWLACLTAAMLLFSTAPAFADEPAASGPESTGLTDVSVHTGAPSYVRIKNRWQSNYLYEASDGRVLYGLTAPEDDSAKWLLEDGTDGTKRIKNAKTGDYISLANTSQRREALTAKPAADGAAEQWYVENASNAGFVLIKSATVPSSANLVVHEEDQLGFAEASADINVAFDSPQWMLEPADTVPAYKPVRIASFTTGDAAADYLYEDASTGEIKHGDLSVAGTTYAEWTLVDYDGHKRLLNVGSGHYVTGGDPALGTGGAADASDQWTIAESDQYDDYVNFRNVANPSEYLNMTGDDGKVRSGSVDPNSNSAQWTLEDPEAGAPPEFVRIKNEWQSFVLYEDENGDLKYGNERTDERDQWHIEKYQGHKLIINRATGHYLSTPGLDGHLKLVALQGSDPSPSQIWSVKSMGGASRVIRNVSDPFSAGASQARLINLQNLTKYAEYAAINPNWGSPKWNFVPVPSNGPVTVRLIGPGGQPVYEAATDDPKIGILQYGDVPVSDKRSIWQLAPTPDGYVWVINVATGHHLSLQNLADNGAAANDPTQATQQFYEVWGSAKWRLEGSADTAGLIKNAAWSQRVLQIDGNGNVKATYTEDDNAKFKVVPTPVTPPMPSGAIRIRSGYNQQYLYEQNGIVKYGSVDESNGYSHWIVEQDGSVTRIKNRVTGHYLETTPDYAYIVASGTSSDAPAAAWSLEPTPDGNRWLLRSQNGAFNDEYLNVQNGWGYAERGLYLTSYGSLQWDFLAAPEAFNTPDMNGGRNEITSTPIQDDTNYVRISSASGPSSGYLTEANGAVTLAATDGGEASQWLAQDFNGRKLLKNRATGHLLAAGENGGLTAVDAARKTEPASQWTIGDSLGYKTIRSEASEAKPLAAADGRSVKLEAAASPDASLWAFAPVVSDVRYEAEDAFQGGGAQTSASLKGYTGTGYADGLSAAGAKVEFAVNAQAGGSYRMSLRYWNAGGSSATLGLYVNGILAQTLAMPASVGWVDLPFTANLRAGINSVSLQRRDDDQGGAAVDALTVKDSVNKDYRGATLPYTTYEAEQGDTNGTVLGPSRTYLDVASEASGRQAVKLDHTGQYVEFKTAKAANSIVLRYSIPDSANGTGTQATLGLYVNGEFRQKLSLDSKYAWEYGSYPWSNNPQDGSPHRFFDEMHALIGDVPAGATITLRKDDDSTADYYIIDLADLEQVDGPYAMPDGFVSVTDYGAVADDGADDTAAFKQAMADAKAQGKGVWFPQGEFELTDGLIDLDQITIRGAGMWYTQLNGAKFFGRGTNVQVYDLLIDGGINVRDDEAHTNAFEGAFGPGSVFQNIWIEHSKAGIWLTKPKDGEQITDGLYMLGLRIRDLMADGINFCVGTSNSMMEQSDIRYPGDDGIAMWSAEGRASVNNTARFNTVSLPWLADNIVVFGGTDNKIQDNIAADTITKGAGIAVSTRFNPVPFAGTTIVERNTMIRTGSYSSDVGSDLGGLWIAANEKDLIGPIIIRNNVAIDSKLQGLAITSMVPGGGFKVGNVLLQDNVIDGAGTKGVEVGATVGGGSVTIDNLIIRGAKIADVANNVPGAFAFDEVNEGFANQPKPFSVQWSDGSTGRFAMTQGASAPIKVKDSAGADITAQATYATTDPSIASISPGGIVAGLKTGDTLLQVTYEGKTRVYTLSVKPSESNAGGGAGGAGGGTPTAPAGNRAQANDDRLAKAKESVIVFAIDASNPNGEVPFTVGGIREAVKANPQAAISVQSGGASYLIPLSLLGKLLSGRTDLSADAELTIRVHPLEEAAAAQMREQAKAKGLSLVGMPVEFGISIDGAGGVTAIDNFDSDYVARTLTIDGELHSNTATALLYDSATGSFRFAPATFEASGGSTTVTVKSTLNGIFVVADHPADFSDIGSHWAQKAIEKLASKLIVQGESADAFAPNRPVTRAEFAALLVRALGLRASAAHAFGDVPASAWFAQEVSAAAEYGLVQGMPDGSFRPGDVISREQMAVMLANAYRLVSSSANAASAPDSAFADADRIHGWAADGVALVVRQGLMQGQSAGAFAPLATATRAEAATVLGRLLESAQLIN